MNHEKATVPLCACGMGNTRLNKFAAHATLGVFYVAAAAALLVGVFGQWLPVVAMIVIYCLVLVVNLVVGHSLKCASRKAILDLQAIPEGDCIGASTHRRHYPVWGTGLLIVFFAPLGGWVLLALCGLSRYIPYLYATVLAALLFASLTTMMAKKRGFADSLSRVLQRIGGVFDKKIW